MLKFRRIPHEGSVYAAVVHHFAQQRSLIPLRGHGNRPKAPAILWKPFQQQRPDAEQIASWFTVEGFSAYGIITGSISSLLILDFDNIDLYTTFSATHPDLANTYTVATKRGYHCYYVLPAGLRIMSRPGRGLDLLAEGKYAVGPGSTINAFTYQVIHNQTPVTLQLADIEKMIGFQQSHIAQKKPVVSALSESVQPQAISKADLVNLYRERVPRHYRNNALFQAACVGRNHGWSAYEVLNALGRIHANTPPIGPHVQETPQKRLNEAQKTIESAFSLPARPVVTMQTVGFASQPQLTNPIRERLLALKMPYVVRTIETLRIKGIALDQAITAQQAVDLCCGVVGRDSVRKAITWLHEEWGLTDNTNQCVLMGVRKSVKNGKGRKALRVMLPDNAALSKRLEIADRKVSDALTMDDLRSSKRMRRTMHRQHIKRKPGQYTAAFLARRLGISTRTLRAYNRQDELVCVEAVYDKTPLRYSNLNMIPPADMLPHAGVWLENGRGCRFPVREPIARRLLGRREAVFLVYQQPSMYRYGLQAEEPPPPEDQFPGEADIETMRVVRQAGHLIREYFDFAEMSVHMWLAWVRRDRDHAQFVIDKLSGYGDLPKLPSYLKQRLKPYMYNRIAKARQCRRREKARAAVPDGAPLPVWNGAGW